MFQNSVMNVVVVTLLLLAAVCYFVFKQKRLKHAVLYLGETKPGLDVYADQLIERVKRGEIPEN